MTKHMAAASLIVMFCLVSGVLGAQQEAVVDELLQQKEASFGNAMYLVLAASELVPGDASVQEALDYLAQAGWGIPSKTADEPVTLGELCHATMQSFGIAGGLFYAIFPGPRYAARELKYLDFYLGSYACSRLPSGAEVLRILGKALAWKEEQS